MGRSPPSPSSMIIRSCTKKTFKVKLFRPLKTKIESLPNKVDYATKFLATGLTIFGGVELIDTKINGNRPMQQLNDGLATVIQRLQIIGEHLKVPEFQAFIAIEKATATTNTLIACNREAAAAGAYKWFSLFVCLAYILMINGNAKEVSLLMPSSNVPTFFVQPAPVPCPSERRPWPSHQQHLFALFTFSLEIFFSMY